MIGDPELKVAKAYDMLPEAAGRHVPGTHGSRQRDGAVRLRRRAGQEDQGDADLPDEHRSQLRRGAALARFLPADGASTRSQHRSTGSRAMTSSSSRRSRMPRPRRSSRRAGSRRSRTSGSCRSRGSHRGRPLLQRGRTSTEPHPRSCSPARGRCRRMSSKPLGRLARPGGEQARPLADRRGRRRPRADPREEQLEESLGVNRHRHAAVRRALLV